MTANTNTQPEVLPPLPEADNCNFKHGRAGYREPHWSPAYTADQMRAYAQQHAASLHAECEALRAGAAKAERRAIMFGDCLTRQILAMRAAVVAWQRDGADAGMNWIANTLAGPGHLPTREEIAIGAQALFEKEVAEAEAFRAANPGPSIDAARAAKEQQG